MDFNYLLAAAAILLGLLSLWSSLWISRTSSEDEGKRKAASLGLFWIYIAIFFGMTSIASTLVGQYWEGITSGVKAVFQDISFAFFISAFLMGLTNIGESTVSMFIKGWKNMTANDFLGDPAQLNRKWYIILLLMAFVILLSSMLGVILSHWFYFGYSVPGIYAIRKYIKMVS